MGQRLSGPVPCWGCGVLLRRVPSGVGGAVRSSLGRAARPVVFGPGSVGPLAGFGGCGLGWGGRWGSGVWRWVALGVGDPLGRDPLFGAGGARAGGLTQIRKTSQARPMFHDVCLKDKSHIEVNIANTKTKLKKNVLKLTLNAFPKSGLPL